MQNKYLFSLLISFCFSSLLFISKANAICPDSLTVTITSSTNPCTNVSNGTATASASSGHSPYTYSWTPVGGTSPTASNLSAGTYTITVTDNSGCTATASVTLTQNPYIISIIGGTNVAGWSGDGGQATNAEMEIPWEINTDPRTGNILVPCTGGPGGDVVRAISPGGTITTIAGKPGILGFSGNGGQATAALLAIPDGVCADANGNIYIAEQVNEDIRIVNTNGIINTFAGNGTAGYAGDGLMANNPIVELNQPSDLKIDATGNIYIADGGNAVIRKINTAGIITTIAGSNIEGYSGDGGQATNAELYEPIGIAFDGAGNLYIADHANNVIRMVNTSGIINTIAGNGYQSDNNGPGGFSGDNGPATAAELGLPYGVAVSNNGNLFISDGGNSRIRMVDPSGKISTVAGNGLVGHYPFGDGGYATKAELDGPVGILVDANNNVIFADGLHSLVRELHACGYCSLRVRDTLLANAPCPGSNTGSVEAIPFEGIGLHDTYLWSTAATTQTINGLSPGAYTVTVFDSIGCTFSASITLTPTAVTANILGPDSICSGDQITLTATGGSTFIWNNGATTSSITVSPTGDSIYQVIARNGPCTANASHVVDVGTGQSLCALAFYTGITPNGDGHNDTWIIDNIELFPGNTVQIYNRWGSEVWSATGYNNNNVVWRGQDTKNAPLPDGTYFYLVNVNSRTYKGWVQLTR